MNRDRIQSVAALFHSRQRDYEAGADAWLTLHIDFAAEHRNHLLDVGQAETETFHIVAVARMHPVEFLEDTLEVFLANADTVVFHADFKTRAGYVAGRDVEMRLFILLHIFDSIVEQIENHVGELHLVDADSGI